LQKHSSPTKFVFICGRSWFNFRVKIITDERCAGYSQAGHPENPARITGTLARLKTQTDLSLTFDEPGRVTDTQILRAHTPEMLARLQTPHNFDADTPFYEGIANYARASAAAALDALAAARAGENAFSLMRPPGHHATREQSMGFCYLNNIAIAALEAVAVSSPSPPAKEERAGERRPGISKSNPLSPALSPLGRGEGEKSAANFKRIAIFDFDVHHGNGTEAIVLNQPGIEFFSVHQHPAYPGTGAANRGRNCFNYPVAPAASRTTYRAALTHALGDLKHFRPDLIAVSAGFDAYAHDPLAEASLLAEDFHWLGHSLRQLKVPFFSLLEGGYSHDLPELVFAYLKGVAGK
jgi:acetoin utilization deacetylase AcuC-like enzyme